MHWSYCSLELSHRYDNPVLSVSVCPFMEWQACTYNCGVPAMERFSRVCSGAARVILSTEGMFFLSYLYHSGQLCCESNYIDAIPVVTHLILLANPLVRPGHCLDVRHSTIILSICVVEAPSPVSTQLASNATMVGVLFHGHGCLFQSPPPLTRRPTMNHTCCSPCSQCPQQPTYPTNSNCHLRSPTGPYRRNSHGPLPISYPNNNNEYPPQSPVSYRPQPGQQYGQDEPLNLVSTIVYSMSRSSLVTTREAPAMGHKHSWSKSVWLWK